MIRSHSLALLTLVLVSLGISLGTTYARAASESPSPTSAEALDKLPLRRMTLELKQARATALFDILGQVSGMRVETDPCVAELTIDLKMRNAPVRWVFAAVATQLDLAYEVDAGAVHVSCLGR